MYVYNLMSLGISIHPWNHYYSLLFRLLNIKLLAKGSMELTYNIPLYKELI